MFLGYMTARSIDTKGRLDGPGKHTVALFFATHLNDGMFRTI